MSKCALEIEKIIKSNYFDCIESGIDRIVYDYKNKRITLKERNYLINLL